MRSAEPTLGCQSSASDWQPPADVVGHNGAPVDASREYFQSPPAEIGELLTAHSTLRRGQQPFPLAARLVLVLGLPVAIVFTFSYLADNASRRNRDGIMILGWSLAVIALLIAWLKTRFKHTCSFVGARGVARYTLKGGRANPPASEVFLFERAEELRTGQTRQFYNGVYTGTTYDFGWTDAGGRRVFRLNGNYHSKEGNPKPDSPFWLAAAAERAWNMNEVERMQQQLEQHGFVQFGIGSGDFVRVGPGFFEFGWKGELARINVEEIKTLSLSDGQFRIHHKDAGWFSRKGKFNFQYSDMANARLFLLAIEKLCGYTFG
jgi:hypothetical protein